MERKLKLGVFGTWRGKSLIEAAKIIDQAEIVAICDYDPKRIEEAKPHCIPGVQVCADFETLLNSDIDAIILANYFHEHAAYAIQAMQAGIPVLCECLPAVTMKECVELVETAEKTGTLFAMAENCPFTEANLEMARLFQSGILGEVIYAEGEYCHPSSPANANEYRPREDHWRAFLPKTYYLAHSIGPLMVMTNLMPKRVIGKLAAGWNFNQARNRAFGEVAGIMLVEMDTGALFRVTGTCGYGPKAHWYRLACEKGGVESVRGTHDRVSLSINPWDLDDDHRSYATRAEYSPERTAEIQKALACGHDGADYWVVKNFVDDVLAGRMPYMDAYRSAAICAVGILGWRSVLNDSKQYDVPDFRNPTERNLYREDDASPFPGKNCAERLPCHFLYR